MTEVSASTAQYSCKISGTTYQVLSFSASEEISELFDISLTLWVKDPYVSISGWMRQQAEVKVKWGDKERKYYGMVVACSRLDAGEPGLGGTDEPWGEYSVELAPSLWLLSRQNNCKIFQEKSADEIIKKVLDERGMAGKYQSKMSSYPKREYCVQYRETDLAFISRLMEEEGIFYYFTHDGKEMMVIGDSAGHYGTCKPENSVEYKTETGVLSMTKEYLDSLSYNEGAYTGKVKLKDFNYRTPKKPLKVDQQAEDNTDLEIYDYHIERYPDDSRGRNLAKIMKEVEELWKKSITGSGTFRSLSAGCKVTISKGYHGDLNGEWVVVSTSHTATQQAETGVQYGASFVAIPSSVTFRPLPQTKKPRLNLQTATVVGPEGEEFYMDDLGRAKVQFHWDLDGKNDEDSSCWIRVAQHYAGINEDDQKKHGFHWHPLIKDEVVVDFLEGDPDTPLIVGSVYNKDHTPPIKPDQLIRNMMLTRYQHCLLFDDKNSCITMATGGKEVLHMNDKKKDQGNIVLTTAGGEVLAMEDVSDDFGNCITMQTKDKHKWLMSEKGDNCGIQIRTKDKNILTWDDDLKRIHIQTTDKHHGEWSDKDKRIILMTTKRHVLVLDDKNKDIYLQSTDGHRLNISDKDKYIQLTDDAGKHSITIDMANSAINVSTQGTLNLSAGGDCNISGKNINLTAKQNVKAKGIKVISDGSATVEISGGQVTIDGKGPVKVSGGTVDVKSKGTATVEGTFLKLKGTGMVDVQGSAMVKIQGGIVKIN